MTHEHPRVSTSPSEMTPELGSFAPTGPAFIAIMPPSPETSKRWWTMYCRECGIEEGMADTADDTRLILRRDEHNRAVHAPTDDRSTNEDQGPAAICHNCVGAGGYEDYDGEWVECSCQRTPTADRLATPTDDETVEWRSVVGHEGMYEVSETGEVRSVARTVQRSNGADQAVAGKMLTKHPDRRGYHLVSLTRDHKAVHRRVHRLVLEAFVGPCPEGHEGLHGDGDMHNNHRSNLRWGTRAENVHDSMRHGTLPVGEAAAASKITEQDVRDIRAAQKAGESMRGLARRYGLALSTVQAIVHRRSWNHVI